LAKAAEKHLAQYVKHLHGVDGCEKLTKTVRLEVANALQEMHYVRNDVVYNVGERGDSFHMFFEGELAVMRGGEEKERLRGEAHIPIILGEKALTEGSPRKQTVIVRSATAVGVSMDKACFDILMAKGKLKKENKRRRKEGLPEEKFGTMDYRTKTWQLQRHHSIRLKDLSVVGTLGVGGFALVELVEHEQTRETYALKTMSKGLIAKGGLQSNVLYEKNVQFMCDSPFIVKLYDTFNTSQTMCFLQEAVLGGDLMALYSRSEFWGKSAHARFYCAGVVLAFEHMHSKCIVYRDLKPENVLIDASGRTKITDMGLAKLSPGKTYTTCGALVSM